MENLPTHQSCTGQALGPQAPRTEDPGLVRSPSWQGKAAGPKTGKVSGPYNQVVYGIHP